MSTTNSLQPLFDLKGQSAIVTGAALGIGFGIARRYVEAGADVLLVDTEAEALERAARALHGPGRAVSLVLDVSADDAGPRAVSAAVGAFGRLDVLVNNAGIYPQLPLLKLTPELFDRVYRVNLRGLAFMCKAAAARFIEQAHGGRIINIGSVDSVHPSMPGLSAYDASKGGVLMLTRSLALELSAHGILVNAILPGGVETEGTRRPLENSGLSPQQAEAQRQMFIKAKIPMGRIGQPDEIAGAAIFLASRAASYMTGASLVIDGGMLLS
jgi:2-deoxy-D-gluconate 3-dehydrogenase